MSRLTLPSGHAITAAEWVQILSYLQCPFIRKTVDESVTSSTVLQNDNELLIAVSANAEYEFFGYIAYTAGTVERFKFGWTGPAGCTFEMNIGCADSSVTTSAGITYFGGSTLATVDNIGAAGTGTTLVARIYGLVRTGVTAGTIQLQWAQNTSGGNATTVKANSFFCLQRLS